MLSVSLNDKIHYYLTCALAFFIPLYPKFLPVIIILLTVNWLIVPSNYAMGWKNLKSNAPLIFMVIYYLFNVIGLIHTSNFRFAHEELETKLSFLILPFVYAAGGEKIREQLNDVLKWFVYGCVLYALICFGYSLYAYFKPVYINIEGNLYNFGTNYFYYTYLSVFFHPSYSALYSVLAVYLMWYLYSCKVVRSTVLIFSEIVLCLFILLLSSKAGWLSLVVVGLFILVDLIRQRKIVAAVLSVLILVATFLTVNIFKAPEYARRLPQMSSIEQSISGKDAMNNPVQTGAEGTTRRIFVWKASWEVFKDHFLIGTGTGDSKDELMKKYLELNMQNEYANKLNSHNQFFTTMIAFGVGGLIVFALCFLIPAYWSIRPKEPILFIFSAIVGLNCLFESIFERQDGVIVYAFFQSVLCMAFFHPGSDSADGSKHALLK